jgi:hypothetical protein
MSKGLRTTFLIHAMAATAAGLLMLLLPGRFLQFIGWAPIDPIVSRLFGAALLALAWSSLRGWRATSWEQVAFVVELEAVFTILACVGLLRHLLIANWPPMVWLLLAVMAAFAVTWVVWLVLHRGKGDARAS